MFEDHLPLSAFEIVSISPTANKLTIKIEPKHVRLSDRTHSSRSPNAWRYIVKGSKEDAPTTVEVNLGPIINVPRGQKLAIKWINTLGSMPGMNDCEGPTLEMPPINPLPMDFQLDIWMKMNPSVGVVTHLHGAVVTAESDGWPLLPAGFEGNGYGFPTCLEYTYTNDQRAVMLWFHDHAMDNTSVQVHAGLAGLYFIRDKSDEELLKLIGGDVAVEIPLVIQDRIVDCGFDRINYWAGVPAKWVTKNSQTSQDFDRPEFLGETIFVNGRPWPTLKLGRKIHRLRILNGSNARTYAIALIDPSSWAHSRTNETLPVWYSDKITVIGNDGGLLPKSVKLVSTDHLLLAPAE